MGFNAEHDEAITEVLSSFGDEWKLTHPVLIREGPRARVYRCSTATRDCETVILKLITDRGACGFTDWASLQFLGSVPDAANLVPRFLAGNVERHCYLIEDLGGSLSLETRLNEVDPLQAMFAVEELIRVYARLHAGGRGHESQFLDVRGRLPESASLGRQMEAQRWIESGSKLEAWLDALGLRASAGLDEALRGVATAYVQPGPFLTFTHGDPAPTNNHLRRGVIRLVDFEYGAYRHALYDITAWNILCPLPRAAVKLVQAFYREEVRTGLPAVDEEECFREGWGQMCAFRALAMLTWIPPKVLEQNHSWAGDWTAREAICTAVGRLARACDGIGSLAAIQELAENAESALLRRFPELKGALPRWSAFAKGHTSHQGNGQ